MNGLFFPTMTAEQTRTAASKGTVYKDFGYRGAVKASFQIYMKQEGKKAGICNCLQEMTQTTPTEVQLGITHAQTFKGTVIYYLKDYGHTSWTIEMPVATAEEHQLPTE